MASGIAEWRKKDHPITRYAFVGVFVALAGIFLICEEWNNNAIAMFLGSLNLDIGSISALFATLAIVFLFGIDEEIRSMSGLGIVKKGDNPNVEKSSSGIVTLILAIVALIAMWLAIRTIGLTAQKYIINVPAPSGYPFFTSDIFNVLSFILTANLCFTLYRTLGKSRVYESEKSESEKSESERRILNWISVPIQAIIIGLIILLPRYSDTALIGPTGTIANLNGYVTIVATFVGALVALCLVWGYLRFKRQQAPE